MKRQAFQVLAAGLIAAAALACGEAVGGMMASAGIGGGAGVGGAGVSGASAQSACSQWEVMYSGSILDCEGVACPVPAGWEPFALGGSSGFSTLVSLRRCVQ